MKIQNNKTMKSTSVGKFAHTITMCNLNVVRVGKSFLYVKIDTKAKKFKTTLDVYCVSFELKVWLQFKWLLCVSFNFILGECKKKQFINNHLWLKNRQRPRKIIYHINARSFHSFTKSRLSILL